MLQTPDLIKQKVRTDYECHQSCKNCLQLALDLLCKKGKMDFCQMWCPGGLIELLVECLVLCLHPHQLRKEPDNCNICLQS